MENKFGKIMVILISFIGIGLGIFGCLFIILGKTNNNQTQTVAQNTVSNIEMVQPENAVMQNEIMPENNTFTNEAIENPIILPGQTTQEINPITPIEPENQETIATSYYYRQLNDYAKIIYDGLKQNEDKLTSGNFKIDFGTKFNTLLHSDSGEQKMNEAFQSAWNAFSYDHVNLFYIDVSKMTLITNATTLGMITTYHVSMGAGNNANYFQDNFTSEKQVKEEITAVENLGKQVAKAVEKENDATKVKKIHNWLVGQLSYDNSTTGKEKYTIYGPLRHAKGVCEGYARSLKYLLDLAKVPCVLVSGTATDEQGNSETHAWNYVRLNNQWFAIDVTWDDPVVTGNGVLSDQYRYRYFLKGSKEFLKDHKEDGVISENSMKFSFPELSQIDYPSY